MKLSKKAIIIISVFIFLFSAAGQIVLAGQLWSQQEGLGNNGEIQNTFGASATPSLTSIIVNLIKLLLSLIGLLMVILILYSGYLWMTAGGDEAKVKKAKDWIKNATIGIFIILAAYGIVNFISGCFIGITSGTSNKWCPGLGAFGNTNGMDAGTTIPNDDLVS